MKPGESEVTIFIIAPGPLHYSGESQSRAKPFNWVVNSRNETVDENDKEKKKAFWYPVTPEALDISDDI